MRTYELAIIVNPNTDERQVTPMLEKHLEPITKNGGTVENIDTWGKRHLAYEIQKHEEGIYVFVTAQANPDDVKEVHRLMTIDEQIMRVKVMRPELHK